MPPSSSVAVHVERNARKFPKRMALIGERGQRTYARLDQEANCLANYLLAQGLGAGDKVTLLAKSSVNWVVAFVAIMKIRAVCVPLNYRLMPEDVANSIADAKCTPNLPECGAILSTASLSRLPICKGCKSWRVH